MDWYEVASSLCREFSQKTPGIDAGMRRAVGRLGKGHRAEGASRLRAIEWGREEEKFERWVMRSVRLAPPQEDVAGLWFEVPEIDLNYPLITVVGSGSFDERESKADWASEVRWSVDARKAKRARHSPEFRSYVLRELQRRLKIGPRREPAELEMLAPLSGGLPLVYMQLLLRRVLPRLKGELLGERAWRGVGFGYASGDLHVAGVLTRRGWEKPGKKFRFAHVEKVEATNADPRLDLNSREFDPRAYLRAGLDLNAKGKGGETPLVKVISDFDMDHRVARAMIERGASIEVVNSSKATPLQMLLDEPISLVKLLLEKGADPNARNVIGHAAMHSAVGHGGKAKVLQLLLERGGDPNLRGMFKRAPLHWVADAGHPSYDEKRPTRKFIDLLLKSGARMEAKDERGATPLMHAVIKFAEYVHSDNKPPSQGHDTVAVMLLKAGADPNCRIARSPHPLVPDGGTPLMCRRYDRVQLHLALLKHGADVRAKSARGLTALDYAKQTLRGKKVVNREELERVVAAMERAGR